MQGVPERQFVDQLPEAFRRYEVEPEQMPAAAPGKVGILKLEFEAREGRTRLVSHYNSGPLKVQRVHYLDPEMPAMAFVFIQSVSGGALQGDRLLVDVLVRSGAQAHVTTQSAAKIYRMEQNYVTEKIRVTVEPGAYLEFLPDFIIPYRHARFYQEVDLQVDEEATLLYWDALAPGRVAFGELFAYDLVFSRLRAFNLNGQCRFLDTLVIEPGRLDPRRCGMLGDWTDVGKFYVISRRVPAEELSAQLHRAVQEVSGVCGGASALFDSGALVRLLGTRSRAVQTGLHSAWREARRILLGTALPPVYKIKYGSEPIA